MEISVITILEYAMAIGIGLGYGSFATMPYYRLPNGFACAGKWIGKKSACTQCDHQLRTRDLVPVFNWLLTRGKCQFCGYKISPVYFFIELSITIFSVVIYSHYGLDELHYYMFVLAMAACMVVITATEHSYRKIPDQVLIVAIMLSFLYYSPHEFNDTIMVVVPAALAGLAYSKIYEKVNSKALDHFGYPKLLAVAGFWLSYGQFFIHLALVMVVGALLLLIYRKSEKTAPLAYILSSSLMLNILYPNWYKVIF